MPPLARRVAAVDDPRERNRGRRGLCTAGVSRHALLPSPCSRGSSNSTARTPDGRAPALASEAEALRAARSAIHNVFKQPIRDLCHG